MQEASVIYILSCCGSAAVCFAVSYYSDVQNPLRPSWQLRLACSAAAAWLMYSIYPDIKDYSVKEFHVFKNIQADIGMASLLGVEIFKNIKLIFNVGVKGWIAGIGKKLLAVSKEK